MTKTIEERVEALEERHFELTEAQLDYIADRAAKKALESVYAEVGRSVVKRFLWIVGAIALGVAAYLFSKGELVVK